MARPSRIDPEVLERMLEKGMSVAEIADVYDVKAETVYSRMRTLGLSRSGEHTAPGGCDVAQRKCMRCGKHFRSSWIGNRMCKPCKGRADVSAIDDQGFAGGALRIW